jgi:hypothetical protein
MTKLEQSALEFCAAHANLERLRREVEIQEVELIHLRMRMERDILNEDYGEERKR